MLHAQKVTNHCSSAALNLKKKHVAHQKVAHHMIQEALDEQKGLLAHCQEKNKINNKQYVINHCKHAFKHSTVVQTINLVITMELFAMITQSFSLRTKLLGVFIFATLALLIITCWISYLLIHNHTEKKVFNHLQTIRETKRFDIEHYIKTIRSQCLSLSESTMITQAIEAYKHAFYTIPTKEEPLEEARAVLQEFYTKQFLPKTNETTLKGYTLEEFFPHDWYTIWWQTQYIANNPNTLDKKQDYVRAPEDNPYNTLHEKYHSILLSYIQRFGFLDLYLIDIENGHVVFNISKEIDFATNLQHGPLQTTHLAKLYDMISQTKDESFVHMTDFDFYAPSYGIPAAFIGTPIYSNNEKIGALILQVPLTSLTSIMTYDKQWREVGLGETGETYLIGKDGALRTTSRFFQEDPEQFMQDLKKQNVDGILLDKIRIYDTTILLQKDESDAAQALIKEQTGHQKSLDYRMHESFYSYTPLNIQDVQWGIVAKIDTAEALELISNLSWRILLILVAIFFCITLTFFLIVYYLMAPFERLVASLKSEKKLFAPLPVVSEYEVARIAEYHNNIMKQIEDRIAVIKTIDESLSTALEACTQDVKNLLQKGTPSTQDIQHIIEKHAKCNAIEKQLHDALNLLDM